MILETNKLSYNDKDNMHYIFKWVIIRFKCLNEIQIINKKVSQKVMEKGENMRMLVRLEAIITLMLINLSIANTIMIDNSNN